MMRRRFPPMLLAGLLAARIAWFLIPVAAQTPSSSTRDRESATSLIDLPTALKLAGARNLDVQIAREKLAHAKAIHETALEQFFPWVSPGIAYHRHDELTQDVAGHIIDVNKQSYAPGGTFGAQVDLGNAIYQSLETHQLTTAAKHGLAAQREESILAAAQGYFDLVSAQASVDVARDAVRISSEYEREIEKAVDAGIAFKGDALHVKVQSQQFLIQLRRASERQRIAAARLAQTLHLDATINLAARSADLVPLGLVETNATLDSLVQRALNARPELKQSHAFVVAARDAKNGAVYGPLVPSIGAQAFVGGLGGGVGGSTGSFGESEDYLATLSWRIGPGGLFDFGRIHANRARMRQSVLLDEQARDTVTTQVVEAFTRLQSLRDQIETAQGALASAQETFRLSQQRKEFGVAIVLESIQAEQELTRTRDQYLGTIAEFNKAGYNLLRSIGQ